MSKQKFHGSCHCGRIKFQLDLDLTKDSCKCNCTFCRKNSFWWNSQVLLDDLKLTQGQDDISEYSNNRKEGYGVFCKHCGTTLFRKTEKSDWSVEGYSVNMSSLDDIATKEINSVPVKYINGKNGTYSAITDPEEIKTLY